MANNNFNYQITNFSGIRGNVDPDDTENGYFKLLKNLVLTKLGSLRTRLGKSRIGGLGSYGGSIVNMDSYVTSGNRSVLTRVIPMSTTTSGLQYLDDSGVWQTVPSGSSLFIYREVTVNALSTGKTLYTTGLTGDEKGCKVHNLNTGEVRRVISVNVGGGYMTLDAAINNSWDGQNVTIIEEVDMLSYGSYCYAKGSSYKRNPYFFNESGADNYQGLASLGKWIETVDDKMVVAGFPAEPRILFWNLANQYYFIEQNIFVLDPATSGNNLIITTPNLTQDTDDQFLVNYDTADIARIDGIVRPTITGEPGYVATMTKDVTNWTGVVYYSDNWFLTDYDITGIKSLGNSLAVWDLKNLYVLNLTSKVAKIFKNRGSITDRSIAVNTDGYCVWYNPSAIYMLPPDGSPIDISELIDNKADRDALFNYISSSTFEQFSAGFEGDEFLFYFGALTSEYASEEQTDIVFAFNYKTNVWRTDSYPAGVFHNTVNNLSASVTYIGDKDSTAVYQLYTQAGDEDSAGTVSDVTWRATTESVSLGAPHKLKDVQEIIIRYKSSRALELYTAEDGGDYFLAKELPASDTMQARCLKIHKTCSTLSIDLRGTGDVDISYIQINGVIKPLTASNI
jgi:hypothetical protein